MRRHATIRHAVLAGVAALGLVAWAPSAGSGQVVIEYNTYCVGYRANLYDADWRLRCAQTDQWRAQEDLIAARRHEGEVAIAVEDQEALVAQYGQRLADSDAAMTDARARLHAYEKRIESARSDLDAARTLHDSAGISDAENRIRTNEAGAVAAADDLKAAEASAAPLNDVRARLVDSQAQLPRAREELAAAHEDVYAARVRLDHATLAVAQALHDRDEALWLLHRDEILRGRSEFARTGFRIDLSFWGGRMPRDPEVVHNYYVHPVGYWVERPVEIQDRVSRWTRSLRSATFTRSSGRVSRDTRRWKWWRGASLSSSGGRMPSM